MQRFLELTDPYSVEPVILVEDPTRPPSHNLAVQPTLRWTLLLYLLRQLVSAVAQCVQFSFACLVHDLNDGSNNDARIVIRVDS